MSLHRLLRRQIDRLGLGVETPPDAGRWMRFLERVSATYAQADESRHLVERSMELSSREMQELHERESRANELLEERVRLRTAELERAERAARSSETRFRSLTEMSSDFYWETDIEHRFTQGTWNAKPERGLPWRTSIGKRRWELPYIAPDEAGWQAHRALVDARLPFRDFQLSYLNRDGIECHLSTSGDPVFDESGAFTGYRGVGTDITARKRGEDKLLRLAQFDSVTGLPNRFLLGDRLALTLSQARRNNWLVGVLFVDLDHFKAVNDTRGHAVGDILLRQVAGRLKECLRGSDIVGRLSGDEFALVLPHLGKPEDAGLLAQKIVDRLATPFDLEGQQTDMSASIGIALYPSDGGDPDTLIRNADTAMYRVKEQGRDGYQYYLPPMNQRLK